MTWKEAAEEGESEAQFELALMYRDGNELPQDTGLSYCWFTFANMNGNSFAESEIKTLASGMTPEQIAKGEALAKEMIKKNPKLIND